MASLGGFGGLPLELGGRPSPEERAYEVLKRAVGEGGSAVDSLEIATLDGLWRFSRAAGLAAIDAVEEAAHWQAWPSTASDSIAEYEDILGLSAGFQTENERRQAVIARWTNRVAADYPGLDLQVESLDTRASLLQPDRSKVSYVIEGKAYDALGTPGTYAGGRRCTNYPNYSSNFLVSVLLDVGAVPPVGDVGRTKAALELLLDDVLPAWNDWVVVHDEGFVLDSSLLDVTAFGA